MKIEANSIEEYLTQIPEERKPAFNQILNSIRKNIPKGFKECINYGMIGFVVPHEIYPSGYHCNPKLPLPFINLASQKNYIAFYHMGLYANKELLDWFVSAYANHAKYKLDMGKSCVRFKRLNDIPFHLIGELVSKMNPKDWIQLYEQNLK